MINSILRGCTGLFLVGILCACAARDVTYSRTNPLDFEGKFQDTAGEALSQVMWDEAKVITLTHKDGEFTPMIVDMQKGKPYILKVINEEDSTVSFRAPEFFNNVSVSKISGTGYYTDAVPELENPLLVSFIVAPLGEREVRLVPLNEGSFQFENAFPSLSIMEFQFAPFSRAATMGTVGAFTIE
jgi:hypothetical protein